VTAAHQRIRPALPALLTVLSLLWLSLLPAYAGTVRAAAAPEVLRAVHTDALHSSYDGSALRLNTRIGSSGSYREADPAGLIFNLEDKGTARLELPDIPAFAFLGKPGDPVWIAPETQDPDLIWPGWDTETIPAGALQNDTVDLTLLNSQGPGNVEIFFNYDGFAGTVPRLFSSADPAIRTLHQPIGRHVHANWAFTKLGTYTLTFQASATTAAGVQITTGPVDYTFVVGPYQAPATPTTSALTVSPNPAGPTDQVVMTATVSPANAAGSLDFFDNGSLLGGAPVSAGQASVRSAGMLPGVHQITARFTPADPTSFAPSTSEPAQLTVNSPSTPPTTPPTSPPTTPPTTPPTSPPTSPTPPPPTGTPPACVTAVLGVGHVDVAARTVGGKLRFQVKDGTKGNDKVVWRDPGTVAFQVRPAADELVPALPAYRFLGAPGATIWQLPQTQADDLLWAGWNTESVDYSALSGPVSWSLDKVQGPGKLALYQFDQFGGPLISFDSGKPLPQSIKLAEPTHAHGNWAFTKQGIYRLTFTYSATTKTGQKLSDSATLPVVVGTTDPAALCPGGPPPTTQPPTTQPPSSHPSTTQPSTTPSSTPSQSPAGDDQADSRRSPARKLVPCVTISTPASSSSTTSTATTGTTSSSGANPAGVTLTNGHADYAVRLEGNALASRIKDGTKPGDPVWRDPAGVTVKLTSAAQTKAPGGAFGFLGATGTTLWQIPQTQKDGVLWLGWNTEQVSAPQLSGGVDWRLDQVSGPGLVAIFEFDSFGQPKVIFNSGDGLPDTYKIPLGTHAHGNWAFTKPGTYRVRFTHSATLVSGAKTSDSATVTFVVGDSPNGAGGGAPAAVLPPASTTPTPAANPANCTLAVTGGSITPGWIVAGVVLVLLGTVAIVATRQRRTTRQGDDR
jgi:putative ABC transporter-associated repeat protein